MPSCWATRRASSTSATLQQPVSLSPPHSRIVTPTTSWPSRASSAAATDESTPPLMATSTFTARGRRAAGAACATAAGIAVTASSTSASVVVRPSDSRSAPAAHVRSTPIAASTCDGSIAPLAHADAADAHTPASSSRNSSASLSMPSMQDVRRAGDLVGRARRSRGGRARRRRARRRGGRAARRRAATSVAALGVGRRAARRPWRRCRRRCGCRCAARAPARRRRSAGRGRRPRARRARRRPSARRTCGRSATAGRRAATRRAGRASAPPARRRCAAGRRARRSRTRAATGAEVGDRADLVVDGHHADDRRRRRPSAVGERVEVDPARGVDAHDRPPRCSTACSTAWCSAAGHTARPPRAAHGAGDRRVVGLGAAAGEHDLAGPAAEHRRRRRRGPRRRPGGRRGRSGASRTGWRSAR